MPFTPNHQQKVNECYPKKDGEGTVTGKLSSLIYYINARPQKLVKVATFLSVKVVKDVQRQKDSYNEVTLDIVDAVMKNCSNYFEAFCPYALTILFHLLQSSSYALVLRAMRSFSEYCARSKSIIGSIQSEEFFRTLQELTVYFSRLCCRRGSTEDRASPDLWQIFGFDGIKHVIELEDFKSERGSRRVKVIIEALWAILRNNVDCLPTSTPIARSEPKIMTEAGQRSIQTLSSLLRTTTATSLPAILDTIVDVCEHSEGWAPKKLCMYFFGAVALNVPQQYIFVVLSAVFKHLESMRFNETAFMSFFFCIYQILSHNRGPLGFSSLELSKNLLSHGRILAASSSVSLPIIASTADIARLPESLSMCCSCIIAVTQYSAFMTQRFDILTYILRKTFHLQTSDPISSSDIARDASDRQSVTTDSFGPTSFLFFQVVWVIISSTFAEQTKLSKFSKIQSPVGLFDKLTSVLSIEDRDTTVNGLHAILLLQSSGQTLAKDIFDLERGYYRLDCLLARLAECLGSDFSSLPAFVLSYRVLKASSYSRAAWIRIVSFLRSLKKDLMLADETKSGYCAFIECLLLQQFSATFMRLDSMEYKKILAEVADSNVYEELFEAADVGVLNQSFGQNNFEFDLDPLVLDRIYSNGRIFSVDELAALTAAFVPSADKHVKPGKDEHRQIMSFQDSFRGRPSRGSEMSSRRSFLSLNIGSNSSKSIKITSPRAYSIANVSNEDMMASHISEASLEDSSPSINVLSSEFDSLSMQVKADKYAKTFRKTILE